LSICQPRSCQYLEFIDKLFGKAIFKYLEADDIARCFEMAEKDRVELHIRLEDYVKSFKFAFVRSGLQWNSVLLGLVDENMVTKSRIEYVKNAMADLFVEPVSKRLRKRRKI